MRRNGYSASSGTSTTRSSCRASASWAWRACPMPSPAPPTTISPTASAASPSNSCARATARPGSTSCRRGAIYPGASICGVPSEVSRAFLRGWYAQNGVSLENPRLGFVCTAQTTDGQHGLSGYFLEHDRELAPEERLQFRPGELPPPVRSGEGTEAACRRLATRTTGEGRAQLRDGIHPLRPAPASRRFSARAKPPISGA